jgi:hypothetical protein
MALDILLSVVFDEYFTRQFKCRKCGTYSPFADLPIKDWEMLSRDTLMRGLAY